MNWLDRAATGYKRRGGMNKWQMYLIIWSGLISFVIANHGVAAP